MFDENKDVATRDQHGTTEVLLKARAQHESEQYGCRVEVKKEQKIADKPDGNGFSDLEHVVVCRVDADGHKKQRTWIQVLVRDHQQLYPQTDHGHVEHDQNDVPDPEACYQPPKNVGMLAD